MSKALNDNVKGAYRPGRAFPDNEAEAKTLAKQLGMSWGGTGAYKNHGACKLFFWVLRGVSPWSSRIYLKLETPRDLNHSMIIQS